MKRLPHVWEAIADWCDFQLGTVEGWIERLIGIEPDPATQAMLDEGDRLRRAFPDIDFDDPTPRKIR